MTYNRIPVAFGATKKVTGPAISYQYDAVQYLVIKGLDLPAAYRVDFCNEGDAQTISMVGDADGVPIPDQLLLTGKKIKAYIMLSGTDEGAVETRYEVLLPVNSRPAPSDIEPTPAEQQQIDALLEALNDGVGKSETSAEEAEAWAVGKRNGEPVDSDDETYENNAKYYAGLSEQGAAEAGWVRFYIDSSGHLHYVRTAYTDLDFYIDGNGHLHVTNAA